jgi:hypothetical protein
LEWKIGDWQFNNIKGGMKKIFKMANEKKKKKQKKKK